MMASFLKNMLGGIARARPAVRVTVSPPHPSQPHGTTAFLLERSMKAVTPHLPEGWLAAVQAMLAANPILVQVVRRRKTKHGDHQVTGSREFSIITVNASGNPWQFVLTLLHEIAHAEVAHQSRHRIAPHGKEWKLAFRELLHSHRHLFPPDLAGPVMDYARNPLYSADSHGALAAALRRHDTLDLRPTVQELALGQLFSLDGRTVLVRGPLLRKWFRCSTTDARVLRVAPTARVHTLYDTPGIPRQP